MPTWLRRITFTLMKEHYDKEAEENEKYNNMIKNNGKSEIARPNISSTPSKIPKPNYVAKVPKK